MNERDISLTDLVVEILLHWRGIIVMMVIGGALLGAFSYVRSAQSAQQQAAERNEVISAADALEKAKEALTAAQLNNIDYVLYYEKLCREKELYMDQSILMQLDADNIYSADILFLITSADLEKSYNLMKAYEDLAGSVELLEQLAEKCQVPASLVKEIYRIPGTSGELVKESNALKAPVTGKDERDILEVTVAEYDERDTIKISIVHYDEKVCQECVQTIIGYMEENHRALVDKMGEHEITVLKQSVGTVGSTDILDSQNLAQNEILELRSSAEKLKEAFSEEERRYYNLLTDSETEQKIASTVEVIAVPEVSLKYVLFGMILAAFVYVFVIFIMYMVNNKLRSTDHLQELYNIPQLGRIPKDEEKKKVFGFVDKWVLALRYWNQRKFTSEEALSLAAVAVKMAAGKEALDTVCLIGCDLKSQSLESCEKIKEFLGREKVSVRILDNILYDAEAMEKLEDVKGVVLVEKAGSTLYTEIEQELELLNRQEIKVLGGVIVG